MAEDSGNLELTDDVLHRYKYEMGWTNADIALQFGCSEENIRQRLKVVLRRRAEAAFAQAPEQDRRVGKIPDDQLRECRANGETPPEIARKFGMRRPSVIRRMKKQDRATAAAATQPREARRYAKMIIDVMQEIVTCIGFGNELRDACDEQLRGPDGKIDLSPRPEEVDVIYQVEVLDRRGNLRIDKRKAKLSVLLATVVGVLDPQGDKIVGVVRGESSYADPRTLARDMIRELRANVETVVQLSESLNSQRAMMALREAVIEEIGKMDGPAAARIAAAVRKTLTLNTMMVDVGVSPGRSALGAGNGNGRSR